MQKVYCELQSLTWNLYPNRSYFKGFGFIEGIDTSKSNKVKKSLIIASKEKRFMVPLNNTYTIEITENFGKGIYNYNFSGFSGFIDLGFINDMGPISSGDWFFYLYINSGGQEVEYPLTFPLNIQEYSEEKYFKAPERGFEYVCSLKTNAERQLMIHVEKNTSRAEGVSVKTPVFQKKIKKIGRFFLKLKRFIGNKILDIAYEHFFKKEIIKNRVVFLSDSRSELSGNFQFVYEELVKRGGYELKTYLYPKITTRRSLREKLLLLDYLCTSKYIFLDDFYPKIYRYPIKPEIEIVQLWHATGAFKTFGFSRIGKKGGPKVRSRNHRNYTKAIVSSSAIRKHYAEAFGISENRVVSTGIPRTDIFFDERYIMIQKNKIYEKYPQVREKKVILFAPTFRGNGQGSAYYDFENLDLEKFYQAFNEEYMMIMKLHPFIKNIQEIPEKYIDFVLDLTDEREINDLLFVADILITDYSSVCFEFALLNRPMIFFAYDLEEYIKNRDFYYPYESFVPGPIVKSTEEVIEVIKNENYEIDKINQFRNKFFDHFDGRSTERVVNEVFGK